MKNKNQELKTIAEEVTGNFTVREDTTTKFRLGKKLLGNCKINGIPKLGCIK